MDEQQQQQLMTIGEKLFLDYQLKDPKATQIVEEVILVLQSQDLQAIAALQQDPNKLGVAMYLIAMSEQLAQQTLQAQQQPNQTTYAKNGAKLNYLRLLRGGCPEGYETAYFKKGGSLVKGCKKCQQKAKKAEEGAELNPVELFKCGGKKKVKKAEEGVQLKKSVRSNIDGGTEVERQYSDGTSEFIVYDSKNRPVGATGRDKILRNKYTDKAGMDSIINLKKVVPPLPPKKKK